MVAGMRNIISILIIALCAFSAYAQPNNPGKRIDEISLLLNPNYPYYNPAKALALCKEAAENGDTKAMNAIGVIYSKGLVNDTVDHNTAREWFEKSAENGYANAYTNLGVIYKDGSGVPQDFVRAYECFSKGAGLNSSSSLYSYGYMHFKGLGCEQDYEKAVESFRKSISKNELGAMYMLGICLRNGYGIAQNTDSARYWLARASEGGYKWATDELMSEDPENISLKTKNTLRSAGSITEEKQYEIVQHKVMSDAIGGDYAGYAIKYDWSGQKIIGQSSLKLSLENNGNKITGIWVENDTLIAAIDATLSDTIMVFSNTGYSLNDHYYKNVANHLEFKDAKLQLVQIGDSIYMAGNIRLYSKTSMEPEKPMYVSLIKDMNELKNATDISISEGLSTTDSFNLIVYPNPVKSICTVAFNLMENAAATIRIIDLSGKVIYLKVIDAVKGENAVVLDDFLSTGNYILQLSSKGKTKQTVIIKQ
ncbi:T9SS C-terminal target domain-containing protein [Dysgonomonas sp. 216]|uniref:T9SS type A sorting domain-containing protein n=1 Tax=Dysgonomonas sp. 216 TaxID=2302934 RepID=UPI001C884445|nr:T9SS type A sorting domain-containing protein [Dysgonomonas sp. 216]NDW17973.1 T9SS C-terminal target domain-containing protein [Dysgonomonas sp. 216]